jgi:MFS family permease
MNKAERRGWYYVDLAEQRQYRSVVDKWGSRLYSVFLFCAGLAAITFVIAFGATESLVQPDMTIRTALNMLAVAIAIVGLGVAMAVVGAMEAISSRLQGMMIDIKKGTDSVNEDGE